MVHFSERDWIVIWVIMFYKTISLEQMLFSDVSQAKHMLVRGRLFTAAGTQSGLKRLERLPVTSPPVFSIWLQDQELVYIKSFTSSLSLTSIFQRRLMSLSYLPGSHLFSFIFMLAKYKTTHKATTVNAAQRLTKSS